MAALGTLARGGRREDIANDVWGEGGTKIAAIRLVYTYRWQEVSNSKKGTQAEWRGMVTGTRARDEPHALWRSRTSLVSHGVKKQLTRRLYRQIVWRGLAGVVNTVQEGITGLVGEALEAE